MIINFLKNLLFPIECQGCGRPDLWLCPSCFRQLEFSGPQIIIHPLDKIYIASHYQDPMLAKLIKSYKYNFVSELAHDLGLFLATYWAGQIALNRQLGYYPLLPIPLSKSRQRWRGFNQAELLAKVVAQQTGAALCYNLIKKSTKKPQASLRAVSRKKNVQKSFVWQGQSLAGKNLILVDDVVTTGATLAEAARTLKVAGANKIYALVLAKG